MSIKNIYYNLVVPLLVIGIIYVLLRIVKIVVLRLSRKRGLLSVVENIYHKIELLFPPFFILVLTINLLWLDVKIFGPIIGLLGLIFHKQLKSYGLGKMMRFQGRLREGYHYKSAKVKGKISKLNPFEIKIESDLGTKFVPYLALQSNQHTISTFADVAVKYSFDLELPKKSMKDVFLNDVKLLLLETPQIEPHSNLDFITLEGEKFVNITLCLGGENQGEEVKLLLNEKKYFAINWTAIK